MHGFLFLAGKRKQRERRDELNIIAMGSRGDPKVLKKELEREED